MLKIKYNVDLKELEKYELTKVEHHDIFTRYEYMPEVGICLYVDEYRNITIFPTYYDKVSSKNINRKIVDVLIKADLVEKVSEE